MSSYHGNVRLIVRFAFAIVALAAPPGEAQACSCMASGPPCQSFFQVDAVFVGTVRSITPTPHVPTVMESVRVEFEDAVAFRGIDGPTQTVMTSAPWVGSCAYSFKEGERYVVYAYRSKPGEPLRTGICSRTRPIAEAAEDLLFFKKTIQLSDSRGCAEANFVLRFDGRVRGSIRSSTGGPAAGVTVQLMPVEYVGTNDVPETIDAVTDAGGQFEFQPVSPGRYVLGVGLFRQSESGEVYPPTYHPSTHDPAHAIVIDIRGGERHDITSLTLPPPSRAHRLKGIVRPTPTDVGPFAVTKAPAPLDIRVARSPLFAQRRWAADQALVFAGAYTRTLGKGIYGFRFQRATGELTAMGLMAETPHASFIAPHPGGNFLYATIEHEGDDPPGVDNAISAYAVNLATGALKFLNKVSSRGEGPNHISVDRTGQTLLVSNYRNGTVATLPILPDGRLGGAVSVVLHSGSSVHPVRQTGPHPHFILTSPDNRFVLVPDLGTDRIFVYRFDAERRTLTPNDPPSVSVRPGSQPRHLAFHPSAKFVYVNAEASSEVAAFSYDAANGTLKQFQTISTLPAAFAGTSTTAEVQVDAAGRFLYVSNRGHDSIAIFAIDQTTGGLTLVDHVSTNGQTPRHFTFDPTGRFLLAGNQNSHSVVVYRVDAASGRLTLVQTVADVPEPACLAFVY